MDTNPASSNASASAEWNPGKSEGTPRQRIIEGTMHQLRMTAQAGSEWSGLISKLLAEAAFEFSRDPWKAALKELHEEWQWKPGTPAEAGMRWEEYRLIVMALTVEGVLQPRAIPTDNKSRDLFRALNKRWKELKLEGPGPHQEDAKAVVILAEPVED